MGRNRLTLDFNIFEDYLERLENLGEDLREVIGETMEDAADDVQSDTHSAIAHGNLPAAGKYSRGATEAAVLQNPKTEWSGSVGEIHLGFDKSVPGSGGWLITGTPKMAPDAALAAIYASGSYQRTMVKMIEGSLQNRIDEIMGG